MFGNSSFSQALDTRFLLFFVLMICLQNERQEGGFLIDDDTGVILMESPDIQDNIIDHSEQLLRKIAVKRL